MRTDAEAMSALQRAPRGLIRSAAVLSLLAPLLLLAARFDVLSAGRLLRSSGRERLWFIFAVFAGISLLEALFFMSMAANRRDRLTFLLLPCAYAATLALLLLAPQPWFPLLSVLLVIAVAMGLVTLRSIGGGSSDP